MDRKIPKLKLGNVECGGGWGLGEVVATLPSHDVQRAGDPSRIFTVASVNGARRATAGDSSDEDSPPAAAAGVGGGVDDDVVHQSQTTTTTATLSSTQTQASTTVPSSQSQQSTAIPSNAAAEQRGAIPFRHLTQYRSEREDDDDTFVDHGSNADLAPARPKEVVVMPASDAQSVPVPAASASAPVAAPSQSSDSVLLQFTTALQRESDEAQSNDDVWEDGRLVSRVNVTHPIFGLTLVGGKSLWVAIGDDPLTLFELSGCDLTQHRSISNVTAVRSMALVQVPAKGASIPFKQPLSSSSVVKPVSPVLQPLSRTNSNNPELPRTSSNPAAELIATSSSTSSSGSTEALWCGLERGRIVIVDLFFCNEDGVISQAHSSTTTVSGIWSGGPGRVWSSGDDHSLKLWDATTRKQLRCWKLSDSAADVCYVPTSHHAWITCREARILLYQAADGTEATRFGKAGSGSIKLRSRAHVIRFHASTGLVWVAMDNEAAAFSPRTFEQVSVVPGLAALAFEFYDSRAIFIGRYATVTSADEDHIIVLDIADAKKPVLQKLGACVPNLSKVGLRCFPRTPLGVAAHADDAQQRCLTVFTTEPTEPIGHWGLSMCEAPPVAPTVKVAAAKPPPPLPVSLSSAASPGAALPLARDAPAPQLSTTVSALQGSGSSGGPLSATIAPYESPTGKVAGGVSPLVPVTSAALLEGNISGMWLPCSAANASLPLEELQREVRDMSTALRQLRVQRPHQDDFAEVYRSCVVLSATVGRPGWEQRAAASLSSISWEMPSCCTSEGTLIAKTLDLLVKGLLQTSACAPPVSTDACQSPSEALAVARAAAPPEFGQPQRPRSAVDELPRDRSRDAVSTVSDSSFDAASIAATAGRSFSCSGVVPPNAAVNGGTDTHPHAPARAPSPNTSSSPTAPTELIKEWRSLRRQLGEVTRAAAAQRKSDLEAVAALSRQNTKLQERLSALSRGVGVLEGSIRAQIRMAAGEGASLATGRAGVDFGDSGEGPADDGDTNPWMSGGDFGTLPEISRTIQKLEASIEMLGGLAREARANASVAAPQNGRSARCAVNGTPLRGPLQLPSSATPTPRPLLSSRRSLANTPTTVTPPPPALDDHSVAVPSSLELQSLAVAVGVRMTPKRFFAAVRAQLDPVVQFIRGVPTQLHCIEGSFCRLFPTSSSAPGDLSHAIASSHGGFSLDTSAVLHDLREADAMCQLCRHELMCSAMEELVFLVTEAYDAGEDVDLGDATSTTPTNGSGSGGGSSALAPPPPPPTASGALCGAAPAVAARSSAHASGSRWFLAYALIDKEELDVLVHTVTTVSLDLEAVGTQLRKSLMERYPPDVADPSLAVSPPTHGSDFPRIMSQVHPRASRLRGLLMWSHVWIRFLATALSEVQAVCYQVTPGSAATAESGGGLRREGSFRTAIATGSGIGAVTLPRSQVEFMLEKLTDWRDEILRMQAECRVLLECLAAGQHAMASGKPSGSGVQQLHHDATGPSNDGGAAFSQVAILSAALQLGIKRCQQDDSAPAVLVDETHHGGVSSTSGGGAPVMHSDDLSMLVDDLMENIHVVLQTKVDSLLGVCEKLVQVVGAVARALPPPSDGVESETVTLPAVSGKPPLDDSHRIFCMTI